MTEFLTIPAIDLLNGQVVRLTQGEYDKVDHFEFTPVDIAKQFEAHGASRIHLVDLDGAKDGKLVNLDTIKAIRDAVSCDLELGGGIRNIDTVNTLFDVGINYIILGSMLLKDPSASKEIINAYPNKIIAGVDAKNKKVAINGWKEDSELSSETLIRDLNSYPLHAIIYTDISTDGMMSGPNVPELSEMAAISSHPIIASGGVRDLSDINDLKEKSADGIMGCIIGKAILSGKLTLEGLWAS